MAAARQTSRGNNARPRDKVRIESFEGGSFDVFNSLQITNDLMSPAEAAFEVGDDGTWVQLQNITTQGSKFKVFINDRLRLTGRVELNDIPIDASNGAVTRFTVRTILADAMYASANPAVKVESTSIKEFILFLWKPLGVVEADFVFNADISRDLMTGQSSDGTKPTVDLEKLETEQAKVNPPETIYQATDRHLKRHGLMLWDSPDGRIVIGAPDDQQQPQYRFRLLNDSRRQHNNVLSMTRSQDWSGIPGLLMVAGTGGNKTWTKSKVRGFAERPEIIEAGFYRPVLIVNEGVKTDSLAQRAANREMTNRSKQFDSWIIKIDGLSYWNGGQIIPFGVDTVCDIETTVAGGPEGAYLVNRVVMTRDATNGDTTDLTVLRRGIWNL